VTWLDAHLPADGSSPDAFMDASVTTRIVAGLPTEPGAVTIGLVDGQPGVSGRG